jgi:hypothetical protein
MKWDFFWRAQNNDKRKMFSEKNVRHIRLNLSARLTLEAAIIRAIAAGMSKGSFQSGCFEVQNDRGIYARADGMSITHGPQKAVFKTWEQLEKEEENER